MSFDDNGWFVGAVAPLPLGACFSVLAPEASSAIAVERLQHHATRFFGLAIAVTPEKTYPAGGFPRQDRAVVEVRGVAVELVTVPCEQAPDVMRAAAIAATRLGGFDALVKRARRLWQLSAADPAAGLAAALPLASLLLGPILAPGGVEIYGVKTGRERLKAMG
jgi:hypothetical protein